LRSSSSLFPYTTLFRSLRVRKVTHIVLVSCLEQRPFFIKQTFLITELATYSLRLKCNFKIDTKLQINGTGIGAASSLGGGIFERSEEHTSELQSRENLV